MVTGWQPQTAVSTHKGHWVLPLPVALFMLLRFYQKQIEFCLSVFSETERNYSQVFIRRFPKSNLDNQEKQAENQPQRQVIDCLPS